MRSTPDKMGRTGSYSSWRSASLLKGVWRVAVQEQPWVEEAVKSSYSLRLEELTTRSALGIIFQNNDRCGDER